MSNMNYDGIIFNIENVANKIQETTGVKLKLKNFQSPEYVSLGQITEEDLINIGFKFIGYSSYIKCPIYRYGKNIEAIFNETILHIYDLRG